MTGSSNYVKGWQRFWSGTIAVSLAPAALVIHPLALLETAAVGALAAVVASLVISSDLEEVLETRLARLCQVAAWGAATLSAVVFIGTVSSWLLMWLLLLALLTSPAVLAAVHGVDASLTQTAKTAEYEAGHFLIDRTNREVLVNFTSAELCQAWRWTHHQLKSAPSAPELAAYSRLRQMVLEELEQRNPRAVTTWLSEGGDAEEAPAA